MKAGEKVLQLLNGAVIRENTLSKTLVKEDGPLILIEH